MEITDEVLKLVKESAVSEKNIKLLILITILEELRELKALLKENSKAAEPQRKRMRKR